LPYLIRRQARRIAADGAICRYGRPACAATTGHSPPVRDSRNDSFLKNQTEQTLADPRFFQRHGPFPLSELCVLIGAELPNAAAGDIEIADIAALHAAGPGHLSLFDDPKSAQAFRETRATAVVTARDLADGRPASAVLLFADSPRLAFAQIAALFYPPPRLVPGIDPAASVHGSARIGSDCQIDAGCIVGPGVVIGGRCHVGANAVIGAGVEIGDDCRIGANATISHALIGARVEIGSGVSVGGPGFGFVAGPRGPVRMPQLGRVVIENDAKIDANCAIDRGAHDDTVIGAGSVIDNLVQIAHNVRIGRYCAIAGQTGIAGSTKIGDGVMIGGHAAISDHLTVGAAARIAGKSAVMRDVDPGTAVGGYPAMPIRAWHRQTIGMQRLFNGRPVALEAPGREEAAEPAKKQA
jgi:UDP-3-O-[3-hydroxymyristoyl] glucosamine N-acyltransferase